MNIFSLLFRCKIDIRINFRENILKNNADTILFWENTK